MANPRCFISYSWDSEEHKTWVRNLAGDLRTHGVEVSLDQWDVHPGLDLPNYMETCIREADYVILVCTPNFAQKANSGRGGVGYEKSIVTGELFVDVAQPGKFVPVLRSGSRDDSLPSYLKSKVFVDFRKSDQYLSSLEELLRHIYKQPRFVRPSIGKKPNFQVSRSLSSGSSFGGLTTSGTGRYCRRCGAVPGVPSNCTGGYAQHDFVRADGPVYCRRCGAYSGQTSECTGGYSHHAFVPSTSPVYCRRCGAIPSVPALCTGGYSHHDFVSAK